MTSFTWRRRQCKCVIMNTSRQRHTRSSSPQGMSSAARELGYTTKSYSTWWAVPFSISVNNALRSKCHPAKANEIRRKFLLNKQNISLLHISFRFPRCTRPKTINYFQLIQRKSTKQKRTRIQWKYSLRKKAKRFRFRAHSHRPPQPSATASSCAALVSTLSRCSRLFALESVCVVARGCDVLERASQQRTHHDSGPTTVAATK